MELLSLTRQRGEPAACIYGATWEGGAVRAGLLFVQAGVTRRTLTFRNPNTRQRVTLTLPDKALRLEAPGYTTHALLEVHHGETEDTHA